MCALGAAAFYSVVKPAVPGPTAAAAAGPSSVLVATATHRVHPSAVGTLIDIVIHGHPFGVVIKVRAGGGVRPELGEQRTYYPEFWVLLVGFPTGRTPAEGYTPPPHHCD